jgi:hypothetical protein
MNENIRSYLSFLEESSNTFGQIGYAVGYAIGGFVDVKFGGATLGLVGCAGGMAGQTYGNIAGQRIQELATDALIEDIDEEDSVEIDIDNQMKSYSFKSFNRHDKRCEEQMSNLTTNISLHNISDESITNLSTNDSKIDSKTGVDYSNRFSQKRNSFPKCRYDFLY